jgi:hypothetical protein
MLQANIANCNSKYLMKTGNPGTIGGDGRIVLE